MSPQRTGVPCPLCKTPLDGYADTGNPVQVRAVCQKCGHTEAFELFDPTRHPGAQ